MRSGDPEGMRHGGSTGLSIGRIRMVELVEHSLAEAPSLQVGDGCYTAFAV